MKLIEYPKAIAKSDYGSLVDEIITILDANDVALSVYQMGSVKDPGISDLDLICVFKEDVSFSNNIRAGLTDHQKNILTHGIFGANEANINQAMSYGCFSNLNHLYGKNLNFNQDALQIDKDVETQLALEYLVKMYITLDAQITFGVIKLRSFLLLAKAVKFDLDILNITSGSLFDKVSQVLEWRKNWFDNTPSNHDLKKLIAGFQEDLKQVILDVLKTEKFYLPKESLKLPGGLGLIKNTEFYRTHKGFLLPKGFSFIGKKYINIQYRLNNLNYYMPFEIPSKDTQIAQRFAFYKNYMEHNKHHYPYFTALTSSLIVT